MTTKISEPLQSQTAKTRLNTDINNKALLIVPMNMNSEYFAAHR